MNFLLFLDLFWPQVMLIVCLLTGIAVILVIGAILDDRL